MDGMTAGFPFGMGGDDFSPMDFQTSMSGSGDAGSSPLMHSSMGHYSPFAASMSRETVFPQSNFMCHRGGGMDLPRFPIVSYAQNISMPNPIPSFNPMVSQRHPFSTSMAPGISSFADMFPQQVSGTDSCGGSGGGVSGIIDSMADRLPSFSSIMPSTSTASIIMPSMPVFPTTPTSMVHSSMAMQESSQKSLYTASPDMNLSSTGNKNHSNNSGNEQTSSGNDARQVLHSPNKSPATNMQTCFPGQVSPQHHHQQQQQHHQSVIQQISGRSVQQQQAQCQSPCSQFVDSNDVKPFSGSTVPDIPSISFDSVMPVSQQRRRQTPRRAAAMAAQAAAAVAAATLAIETNQVQLPSMMDLLGKQSGHHTMSSGHHGMPFSHQMSNNSIPSFISMGQNSVQRGRMQNSKMAHFPMMKHLDKGSIREGLDTLHQKKQILSPRGSFLHRRTVVPFYKAGSFSLREPEVFECQTRKVPQISESVQTGQDSPQHILPPIQRPLYPNPTKASAFGNVDPMDGKGGFHIPQVNSGQQHSGIHKSPRSDDKRDHFKLSSPSYVEGEGYAKRGNSKTVVSPSFGEAAARAVMTTCVADSATVVTVAIMSRQKSMLKPIVTNSLRNSVSSLLPSRDSTEDVKENIVKYVVNDENAQADNSKDENTPTTRTQIRRGRRSNSASVPLSTSQRGRSMRRREMTENGHDGEENFEKLMEERKEKARIAEQERMEISVRIDDSQCVTYGEQKRWQCDQCDKSYTTKHNLVMHILDHNGIKPHLCLVCGRYFKQLSHLNTHMLTHDNVRPHVCTICGKGFTQISHLKRHQAVHLDSKPYYCDECGRGFTYPSELRLHKERHQQGTATGEHNCLDCGEDFASSALLKQHQLLHENRDELSCTFCGRKFRYPSQLKDHIVIHSGTRPYMCTECGMDFMKEHHLRAHQFTHTGLRPYSCPECGRSFNQRANMIRHQLIHKAVRSFKCEFCEKTFTQPQTLKAHMVVHADKKPYACQLCGKEFGRLHNLHGHMHMHNNSKPYVCFCGSSFTLKGNLNRHKKVKHGLNESTESMEEDAVNFLSSWSERAREERSGDDTMDGNDGSSLDNPDKSSSRKQRKSIPRKIPRRSSSTSRKDSLNGGEEEEEEEEEEDEDEDDDEVPSLHFQALTDEADAAAPKNDSWSSVPVHNKNAGESTETKIILKKSRRIQEKMEATNDAIIENEDFVRDLSESDKEEVPHDDGTDDEWVPSVAKTRKKDEKGAKLDSLIAEKFKSS